MAEPVTTVIEGDGYSVGSLDGLGEGPGFRKIRNPLGVTAFGINAIVLPPGYPTRKHFHEHQEETYFVHEGHILITFGDGSKHLLGPGGIARVAANTVRQLENIGDDAAVYVCIGGKDGYVERDGVQVTDEGEVQAD